MQVPEQVHMMTQAMNPVAIKINNDKSQDVNDQRVFYAGNGQVLDHERIDANGDGQSKYILGHIRYPAAQGADLKKALLPSVEQAKKQVEDYKKPDNKIIEIHYQGELSRFKSDQEEYEKKMQYWQNNYPEDIRVLIKNRLEKYLNLAATVDFEAELVLKNGKKKFVNPAYESKHSDWKTIFRAGKEVYQIVKPLAEDWLSKL